MRGESGKEETGGSHGIKLIIRSEDRTLLSPLSQVGKHSGTGIKQITRTPSSGVGSSLTSELSERGQRID
jgi:hypothetical protein